MVLRFDDEVMYGLSRHLLFLYTHLEVRPTSCLRGKPWLADEFSHLALVKLWSL